MSLAVIILAAGKGSRMKSDQPKVMHPLAGRPLISWVADAVAPLQPDRIVVVTAPGMDAVVKAVGHAAMAAIQSPPRGTGDAVRAALPALNGFKGDVLILLGDMPFISTEILRDLIAAKKPGSSLSVLAAHFEHPPAFGRLVLGDHGGVTHIVEDRDCTAAERAIKLCALGAYCIDGRKLSQWIGQIGSDNAQAEYYFPDIVGIAHKSGTHVHAHVTHDEDAARGVNDRADLAKLERIMQDRLRLSALRGGATMHDPRGVYFSWDTQVGRDVVIEPGVFFGPGVSVGDNVHIKAFSHIEGAAIAQGAIVGPFARLRPGADIGENTHIGNFVEIKNAKLGEGVKANHHAYIGDADVGARTNFSCGAITVNYDGVDKHRTTIGADAMIGSNVSLVAPVTIGDGAYVGAGSTITKDVPAGALGIARAVQRVIAGWAVKKSKG